jgi:hypothetical protein
MTMMMMIDDRKCQQSLGEKNALIYDQSKGESVYFFRTYFKQIIEILIRNEQEET